MFHALFHLLSKAQIRFTVSNVPFSLLKRVLFEKKDCIDWLSEQSLIFQQEQKTGSLTFCGFFFFNEKQPALRNNCSCLHNILIMINKSPMTAREMSLALSHSTVKNKPKSSFIFFKKKKSLNIYRQSYLELCLLREKKNHRFWTPGLVVKFRISSP